ncbi:hypothetical protein LSM04_009340 [Trypanosoma melophagium]|uniref:uncharacterized protein n=1 Tax=Trypanosoma melophagium TaxID=715481 RepID=UPI00351A1E86|nr:hypothetical protein LSM04_009340 [Trypanosoma melophagium]
MCPLFGRLARAVQITSNPYCKWRHPVPTMDLHNRGRRPIRSTSTCPICEKVSTSTTNMKLHAKRVHPGESILKEQLVCGHCSGAKIFLTFVSRAGNYRKCAEYQRITHTRQTKLVDAPTDIPEDASLGPQETLPHLLWECGRLRAFGITIFGPSPTRLKLPFETKRLYGVLNKAMALMP